VRVARESAEAAAAVGAKISTTEVLLRVGVNF